MALFVFCPYLDTDAEVVGWRASMSGRWCLTAVYCFLDTLSCVAAATFLLIWYVMNTGMAAAAKQEAYMLR